MVFNLSQLSKDIRVCVVHLCVCVCVCVCDFDILLQYVYVGTTMGGLLSRTLFFYGNVQMTMLRDTSELFPFPKCHICVVELRTLHCSQHSVLYSPMVSRLKRSHCILHNDSICVYVHVYTLS